MPVTESVDSKTNSRTGTSEFTPLETTFWWTVVLLGLGLRIYLALTTYLNPDEAAHVLNAYTSWREINTYAFAIDQHPPMLLYLLHFVLIASHTELAMRLLPVACGSFFPVVLSLWLRRIAGKTAAAALLFLLTFTPHFVNVSSQVRDYSLAFLLMSLSLIAFEAAVDTRRWLPMLGFDLLLLAAAFTDYSIAWFAGAMGVYALMRLGSSPLGVKIAWVAGQAATLAWYALLFMGYVRYVPQGTKFIDIRSTWLLRTFPHPGAMLRFPFMATRDQFGYLVASEQLSIVAFAVFPIAMYLLWTGRISVAREKARPLAFLLILPFIFGIAGAYALVYPYGRSRHTALIGLFGAIGLALFLGFLPRRARPMLLCAAVGISCIWIWVGDPYAEDISRKRNRKSELLEGIAYLHATIPAGATIFTDRQTLQMLIYYEGGRTPLDLPGKNYYDQRILAGRWRALSRDYELGNIRKWQASLAGCRQKYNIPDDQRIWVVQTGWTIVAGPSDEKLPFSRTMRVLQSP